MGMPRRVAANDTVGIFTVTSAVIASAHEQALLMFK